MSDDTITTRRTDSAGRTEGQAPPADSPEALRNAFLEKLYYSQGVNLSRATPLDCYMALAYAVRDRLMRRWLVSVDELFANQHKVVCYLSAEFLVGRQLGNNLLAIDCLKTARTALSGLGVDFDAVLAAEPEPGLGNGGLGRLAACFLDSLATLSVPAVGYGIRYEYGIFRQTLVDGWQVEQGDDWLKFGNPWEIARPERTAAVGFGGHLEWENRSDGSVRRVWKPAHIVLGTPHDTLVAGFGTPMVGTLRLWRAHADQAFDFDIFNAGDYSRAVEDKVCSENISKVLYPNDWTPQGRELRLKQQYFFVASSLHNIIAVMEMAGRSLDHLPASVAIQLNDTHPAIAVAELTRILVDLRGLAWERAWDLCVRTFGFTNHTLLGEALERWPVPLFERLLPRHLEIIYEINRRFLDEVSVRFQGDSDRISRMSIIEEGPEKRIRMAHLATIGSHAVNGVAALHSELVKQDLLPDFYAMWPDRFSNKTNGVAHRRWIALSNPELASLVTESVGSRWLTDLNEIGALEKFLEDGAFHERWRSIKRSCKARLSDTVGKTLGVDLDPDSIFDVQVKRIHEYKRQLLNVLHVIALYHDIVSGDASDRPPRVCLFGGKAAPGYFRAKLIIKLINSVAEVVNSDRRVAGRLKVMFLPNFSVSLGEAIYPAADLSEQISTAGMEASGTGNMKFTMNGALTIGTFDGANIEIREAVGAENFFLFGHKVEQLRDLARIGYQPGAILTSSELLRRVIGYLTDGSFARGDRTLYRPLVDELLSTDRYFLLADFGDYLGVQRRAEQMFRDCRAWTRAAIANVARSGKFSSDRTVLQYCREIWGAEPVRLTALGA